MAITRGIVEKTSPAIKLTRSKFQNSFRSKKISSPY